jgi:2-polyprenyl-3-methyl-5-hydroxy-6-metoxy-1,4-benzoquinol methylase
MTSAERERERESNTIEFCPICNSSKNIKLKKYDKDHLTKCKKCSFVYSLKIPSKLELDSVYNNYNYDDNITSIGDINKKTSIAKLLFSQKNIAFVLDVGCGAGVWLDILKENKCKTYGTEYNDKQKSIALSKGHKILEGGLFPIVDDGVKFDLIIFTEVIEHIQNPIEALLYLNSLLAKDGLIYITTPNFSAIERYVLKDDWGIISYPEHLTYFTPKTLNHALVKSNFSKIKIYTENISIFRIIEAYNKNSRRQSKLPSDKISEKIQSITNQKITLKIVKKIINFVLNIFGVGVSIVCIYQKKN